MTVKYLCTECNNDTLTKLYKQVHDKEVNFFRVLCKANNRKEAQQKCKELLNVDISFKNAIETKNNFEKDLCNSSEVVFTPCSYRNSISYCSLEDIKNG